MVKIMHLGKN